MKKYLFSIIVIFKNEGKKLEGTLKCVNNQDFPKKNFELICVDDGSSDNSYKIAKKYTNKLIRFKRSVGISRSRNEAIKVSQGDIILFLDGHVTFELKLLRQLQNLFLKYEIQGVCGRYESMISTDWDRIRDIRRQTIFKKNNKTRLITLKNFTTFSTAIGAMYKKDILKAHGYPLGFEDSAGEDTFLQIKMHNMGKRFLYSPRIKAYHNAGINYHNLLFNKLVREVRATGNVLTYGSKYSLTIPYLNYFLDYPLFSLLSLVFFSVFRNPLFIYLLVLDILNYLIRLIPLFLINKPFLDKMETVAFILSKELFQMLYLPYFLLNPLRNMRIYMKTVKTIGIWEISKWLTLFG